MRSNLSDFSSSKKVSNLLPIFEVPWFTSSGIGGGTKTPRQDYSSNTISTRSSVTKQENTVFVWRPPVTRLRHRRATPFCWSYRLWRQERKGSGCTAHPLSPETKRTSIPSYPVLLLSKIVPHPNFIPLGLFSDPRLSRIGWSEPLLSFLTRTRCINTV